jgi:hypothetical protein
LKTLLALPILFVVLAGCGGGSNPPQRTVNKLMYVGDHLSYMVTGTHDGEPVTGNMVINTVSVDFDSTYSSNTFALSTEINLSDGTYINRTRLVEQPDSGEVYLSGVFDGTDTEMITTQLLWPSEYRTRAENINGVTAYSVRTQEGTEWYAPTVGYPVKCHWAFDGLDLTITKN